MRPPQSHVDPRSTSRPPAAVRTPAWAVSLLLSPPAGQHALSLQSELDGEALAPDPTARGKARVQAHAFRLTLPRCPARLRPRDGHHAVWLLVGSQPRPGRRWTSEAALKPRNPRSRQSSRSRHQAECTQSPLVDQNVARPTWFSLTVNKSKLVTVGLTLCPRGCRDKQHK